VLPACASPNLADARWSIVIVEPQAAAPTLFWGVTLLIRGRCYPNASHLPVVFGLVEAKVDGSLDEPEP